MSSPARNRLRTAASSVAALLLALAAHAVEDELPFITTPDHVTVEMLQLAGVKRGDFVLDLGSGDGRIPITAARRFGARGLGVEIVPDLVARSRVNAQAAGVADRVAFREEDLFATDLSVATVITMYLLPDLNLRLRPALLALAPGTRVVSHDWDMGDWVPDRTVVVDVPDKTIGREKLSRLHLWTVPARLEGLWCGRSGSARAQLAVVQRYQRVEATLTIDGTVPDARVLRAGRIDGADLVLDAGAAGEQRWRWSLASPAARLELRDAASPDLARWRDAVFVRAPGATCPVFE